MKMQLQGAAITSTRRESDNQLQQEDEQDGGLKRLDLSPEEDEEHYVR